MSEKPPQQPRPLNPQRRPPKRAHDEPAPMAKKRFVESAKARVRANPHASEKGGHALRQKRQKVSLVKVTAGEFFTSKPRDKT